MKHFGLELFDLLTPQGFQVAQLLASGGTPREDVRAGPDAELHRSASSNASSSSGCVRQAKAQPIFESRQKVRKGGGQQNPR
jgi:hypothetical protein